MATIATSLSKSLPKPKYTGDEEELPAHVRAKGPRVVDAASLDSQIVLKRKGPPPYGQRAGWRPRAPEDFGDGGAFPEIPVAQYPLDMGRKTSTSSNSLALQVDAEGKVQYDAIARRGHSDSRIIHSSFKDLIPLRQRADVGELSLEKPSDEVVQATKEKTQAALASLVSGAVSAQNPKNVKGLNRTAPTYVRYTPSSGQMGDHSKKNDRIFKIVARQEDPMAPPKFKHKKIPGRAPSPPPPVMHSPPRKLTAEVQEAWKIPPPVSNWKNPKGYTVPLDKRLAADGRGLQDVTINDKFSQFAEALYTADRHAREEVKQRALMQHKLAEKEKSLQEEKLRQLAQKAREDRAMASSSRRRSKSRSRSLSRSRSVSSYGTDSEEDAREREQERRERNKERERELRMSKMGAEKRMKALAREQGRDISEKVALGLAKPTASADSMYDSRLFNQSSGFSAGFNEDQPYDKPLFAAQEALNSIYRPKHQEEDVEDADATMDRLQRSRRFDGFKDAAFAEDREGPVQFEKDRTTKGKDDDPFNIGQMISEVTGKKRYGIQEGGSQAKRARVEDDDDD
jgi:SNW domain-containing protein 1